LIVGTVVVSYFPTTNNDIRSRVACEGSVGENAVVAPGAPVVGVVRVIAIYAAQLIVMVAVAFQV
jgi:hypothetical protein